MRLTDLRAPRDLQDRSRNRHGGHLSRTHQAEIVVVGAEVVVCTGMQETVIFVGRVARQAIGPRIVQNVCLPVPGNQAVTGTVSSCAVNRIHVMAEIQGKPIHCLLDSGCDRSVIGRRCVPSAKLNPSTYELFTANKAPLRVIGDLDIAFTVDGHPMEANLSVSPDIEKLLLGSDWLVRNQCHLNFRCRDHQDLRSVEYQLH